MNPPFTCKGSGVYDAQNNCIALNAPAHKHWGGPTVGTLSPTGRDDAVRELVRRANAFVPVPCPAPLDRQNRTQTGNLLDMAQAKLRLAATACETGNVGRAQRLATQARDLLARLASA